MKMGRLSFLRSVTNATRKRMNSVKFVYIKMSHLLTQQTKSNKENNIIINS